LPDRDWQAEIAVFQERERKARAILGVSETADRAAIRRAFRQASMASHPDKNRGDSEASRRFQLICCAYKFLTEGEACPALDEMGNPPPVPPEGGKFRLDNPWGYWCWWRDKYFGSSTDGESKDAGL
jgi:DnaJ-class molecular chaperone